MDLQDDRGVSNVIGAVLIFGLVVSVIALVQMTAVPAWNAEVEFNHYQTVEHDLQQARSAILDSGKAKKQQVVAIKLGTGYPQRAFLFNAHPAQGQIYTEDLGTIDSTGGMNIQTVCGAESPVETDTVIYRPGYNYWDSSSPIVYEHSVLYKDADEANLAQTEQILIQPDAKVVSVHPIQGNLSKTGLTTSVTVYRGQVGARRVTNTTLTMPTRLTAAKWDELVGGSVAVSQAGDRVTFELNGTWTVYCRPIGLGDQPQQPDNPPTLESDIGENNNATLANPVGPDAVVLTDVENAGGNRVILNFTNNNATNTRQWDEARLAFYSGSQSNLDPSEVVGKIRNDPDDALNVYDNFEVINQTINITGGTWTEVSVQFENVQGDGGGGGGGGNAVSNDMFVLQIIYENGERRTYFAAIPG